MKILQEFKTFAMRGNVIDLAVGIVIGTAFGKIVSSLVTNVIMPPIGMLLGKVDFSNLKIVLKAAGVEDGKKVEEVAIGYGAFVNTIIDFVLIAAAIFLLVKAINSLQRKQAAAAPAPEPTKQELLLGEIRDILKEKK